MCNERITDLARQAGLIAPYGSDHRGLRDFNYMMFAELIISECTRIANSERTAMEIDRGTHLTADAIKKHFGVE